MTAATALPDTSLPTPAAVPSAPASSAHLRLLPPPATGVWWARIARRGAGAVEHSLVAVASDRFPAGTPVDLTDLDARGRRPTGWLVDVRYRATDGSVVRIDVAAPAGRPRPRPCFTEVHSPGTDIPTVTLHAFTPGTDRADGAMLVPGRAPAGAVRIGCIRWAPRSGLVDAVRVEPAFRGRGYGRLLVHAAEGLRALRGWAPLRTDGRRPAQPEPRGPSGVERLLGDLPTRLI